MVEEGVVKEKDKTGELLLTADDSAVSNSEIQETLFLPPGTTTDVTSSDILGLVKEDNSDLLNVDDDLDKLLSISTKPKPSVSSKPPTKPRPSPKPGPISKSNTEDSMFGVQDEHESEQMAEDDILKYIQDNAEGGETKLDLF
ncbi:HCLS1-binding protein 3-like [Lytechinus variegatus]|uniref:HCLS1-binding protein 3-like n=1 Tax=Lytechinus variegatus TaxID=7654 RepID=UPI001BB1089A|nr:HCLS1-binding protein 3-like [Lytechinus variegatus]